MEYIRLGNSGLKVSRICLGAMSYGAPSWREWVLDGKASRPFLRKALDLGINFIDTADMYSLGISEEIVGRAIRDHGARNELVIATKVYMPMGEGPNQRGLSRKHIMEAIDASLRRLGTDHVDLYYIHRWDYDTPIEETMEALDDVVKAGKVRYLGASSMFAWQFAKAQCVAERNGWTRFVAMQNFYNLAYREEEREMLPLCADKGVGVVPWSPLARGFLARTPGAKATRRGATDEQMKAWGIGKGNDRAVLKALTAVARARGVPNAQVAIAWVLSRPGITAPIVGFTKPRHFDDAMAALDLTLADEEIAALEKPYKPHSVVGHS